MVNEGWDKVFDLFRDRMEEVSDQLMEIRRWQDEHTEQEEKAMRDLTHRLGSIEGKLIASGTVAAIIVAAVISTAFKFLGF